MAARIFQVFTIKNCTMAFIRFDFHGVKFTLNSLKKCSSLSLYEPIYFNDRAIGADIRSINEL